MAKQKDYKVGVYVRLSNEDARAGESVSVENQKLMLTKHVEEMGWKLREIYVDDGFSGTNQNRPAFQRMMADVKQGFINVILIKDLSRLGRNYLEVGNLAEVFLPEYGCELISLNEPLDEMMVFRNWFNEQYSKTTSKKVRAAKRISAEHGKYIGTYAPYGYKKDPNNRHRLIIDEIAAPVARSIFEMRASGMGFRAIASKLNEDGITPPKDYYYQSLGQKNPFVSTGLWNDSSVKLIIANEAYVGNVVQGKFGTVSYKNSKAVRKPKEEWVRIEGQHEPLINRGLWERVQALSQRGYKPRRRSDGEISLFAGLLHCADCSTKMRAQTERGKRKNGSEYKYISYICGNYARSGKSACAAHIISENILVELVVNHIRNHAHKITYNEEYIVESLISAQSSETISYRAAYLSELEAHKKQIAKLDLLIESLYEDKVAGVVPDSLFRRQIEKYEQGRSERLQSVEALEERIGAIKHEESNSNTWEELIKQYKALEVLDSEILLLLIDKITVGEAQIVDGKRTRDIQVVYNYAGDVEGLGLTDGEAVTAG
ncbi:MAG: recombinase family protein [Defluviitaleaceae bacterium]|nr:recombinase family protein [Defluviitaleaceae bacterium]